jgi:hypothetical protein
MMVVQELNQRDWVNCSDSSQAILQNVPANDVVLSNDKLTFICQDASRSKIFGIGRKTTLDNSMNDLYTANVLLFGVMLRILV